MDKYRPCPSTIAMFTSDSQHPPRSKHAVYLGEQVILWFSACTDDIPLATARGLSSYFTVLHIVHCKHDL